MQRQQRKESTIEFSFKIAYSFIQIAYTWTYEFKNEAGGTGSTFILLVSLLLLAFGNQAATAASKQFPELRAR